jgi:hypothetical protein
MGQKIHSPFVPYPMPISDVRPVPPLHRNAFECVSEAEVAVKSQMRKLWEQHVAWTRILIISIAANLVRTLKFSRKMH